MGVEDPDVLIMGLGQGQEAVGDPELDGPRHAEAPWIISALTSTMAPPMEFSTGTMPKSSQPFSTPSKTSANSTQGIGTSAGSKRRAASSPKAPCSPWNPMRRRFSSWMPRLALMISP